MSKDDVLNSSGVRHLLVRRRAEQRVYPLNSRNKPTVVIKTLTIKQNIGISQAFDKPAGATWRK